MNMTPKEARKALQDLGCEIMNKVRICTIAGSREWEFWLGPQGQGFFFVEYESGKGWDLFLAANPQNNCQAKSFAALRDYFIAVNKRCDELARKEQLTGARPLTEQNFKDLRLIINDADDLREENTRNQEPLFEYLIKLVTEVEEQGKRIKRLEAMLESKQQQGSTSSRPDALT